MCTLEFFSLLEITLFTHATQVVNRNGLLIQICRVGKILLLAAFSSFWGYLVGNQSNFTMFTGG